MKPRDDVIEAKKSGATPIKSLYLAEAGNGLWDYQALERSQKNRYKGTYMKYYLAAAR